MLRGKIYGRTLVNAAGVVILLFGLTTAAVVYGRSGRATGEAIGYEQGDGSSYPVMPDDSKKFRREMELYGGKANVLADELRRSFVGLFEGRSLAVTVACVTVVAAAACFFVAACLL